MKESPQDIQLALSNNWDRFFRMQAGTFRRLYDDAKVTIGVPGMSDLIGFHSRVITPEDVGKRVAIYTALEVKSATGRTDKHRLQLQSDFHIMVRLGGGIAGFARSVDEAKAILNQW